MAIRVLAQHIDDICSDTDESSSPSDIVGEAEYEWALTIL